MIRWLWSRMIKWGWDFSYQLPDDDIHVGSLTVRGSRRRRGEDMILISDEEIDLTDPIRFSVQQVEGGTLIESRWTDPKTDNYVRKLHIVTQDENLSESIGKIVTMELLKK